MDDEIIETLDEGTSQCELLASEHGHLFFHLFASGNTNWEF
jgi:hypothetical protein